MISDTLILTVKTLIQATCYLPNANWYLILFTWYQSLLLLAKRLFPFAPVVRLALVIVKNQHLSDIQRFWGVTKKSYKAPAMCFLYFLISNICRPRRKPDTGPFHKLFIYGILWFTQEIVLNLYQNLQFQKTTSKMKLNMNMTSKKKIIPNMNNASNCKKPRNIKMT